MRRWGEGAVAGERLPWKELKGIKSLAEGRRQCGIGDFHRLEKILSNHR